MRVLVVYGSKRGGTAGLAEMISEALVAEGLSVEVRAAGVSGSPSGYEAVIVAGALYASRWHRDACRFVRRHDKVLRDVQVWLVASGPLDDTARAGTLPPVRQVARLVERIGARGQVTFGGRLEPGAKGFLAGAMAKKRSGDWRDREHVREFAKAVALAGKGRLDGGGEAMKEQAESDDHQRPKINLTAAIGEAGHEVQILGFEGIPDSGPTLDDHDDDRDRAAIRLDAAIAQFPVD